MSSQGLLVKSVTEFTQRSKLRGPFAEVAPEGCEIDDPRQSWRVPHPLPEVLLLVVCGTICDCEDYDEIAEWGDTHLDLLRRYAPYHHGVPSGRWLTLLMNRIAPGLFESAFTSWVSATWPEPAGFVAIDGKTSRRSHDRTAGTPPLHLVSAFATTTRLVLGQDAVPDKASETARVVRRAPLRNPASGLTGDERPALRLSALHL